MNYTLRGGVRITARYEAFGRPASMTFHGRSVDGHEPTYGDIRAICENYGLWENTGFLLGYFLLRSSDSVFTVCNGYSLDDRQRASFVDQPFSRSGLIPGFAAGMMPTSVAPIIRWGTAEKGIHSGRTYAVGITTEATKGNGDAEELNGLYVDALTQVFEDLAPIVFAPVGYKQVHLVPAPSHSLTQLPVGLDITSVGCYVRCGTQRRRTRGVVANRQG